MKSRSRKKFALVASLLFHAALAAVLLFWYVPSFKADPNSDAAVQQPVQQPAGTGTDRTAKAAEQPPASVTEPIQVSDEEVQRSVESQIAEVQKLDDDRKRSELERNLRRLESISNEENVQKVSEKIAGALGLDSDQYSQKKEPAEGEFDFDTAQIESILREKNPQGQWTYQSVMIDAQGRRTQVDLSPEEGQQLHQTFETMQQFPLAQGIYRSVVMPMMQKLIEAEKAAQQAHEVAEEINQTNP